MTGRVRWFAMGAALWGLVAASPAAAGSAADVAAALLGRMIPFAGTVTAVSGDTITATVDIPPPAGTLARITGADGSTAGYAVAAGGGRGTVRFVATGPKSGVKAGSGIEGFPLPVRMLILAAPGADAPAARLVNGAVERLRESPRIDAVPADVARYFLERNGNPSPRAIPGDRLARVMGRTGAALAVAAEVDGTGTQRRLRLDLMSPGGAILATEEEPFTVALPRESDAQESGTGSAAPSVGTGSGFLSRPRQGVAEGIKQAEPASLLVDRVRFIRTRLPKALRGVVALADGRVALLYDKGVAVAGRDALASTPKGTIEIPAGEVMSCVAADTDGDGVEEIFVNSSREGQWRSFTLNAAPGGTYAVDGRDLPFYFSKTVDGDLLAQGGGNGGAAGAEVFGVRRAGREYTFVPMVTLATPEPPVGLDRADLDGDGVPELFGVTGRGALSIFTLSGVESWRSDQFSLTFRGVEGPQRLAPVPPRAMAFRDQELGTVVAVAGARYRGAETFRSASLDRGFVRYVTVREGDYLIAEEMTQGEGWIADLFRVPGSPAAGFVTVIPGFASDESELFLPEP